VTHDSLLDSFHHTTLTLLLLVRHVWYLFKPGKFTTIGLGVKDDATFARALRTELGLLAEEDAGLPLSVPVRDAAGAPLIGASRPITLLVAFDATQSNPAARGPLWRAFCDEEEGARVAARAAKAKKAAGGEAPPPAPLFAHCTHGEVTSRRRDSEEGGKEGQQQDREKKTYKKKKKKTTYAEYIRLLTRSKFMVSPAGFGWEVRPDSRQTYECFFLSTSLIAPHD
jgi:hypothetical protein